MPEEREAHTSGVVASFCSISYASGTGIVLLSFKFP
jgi:hypothetical protein